MSKAKALARRAADWLRHDLREIVAPSSLPDPPGYVPAPRTSLLKWLRILRHAGRAYVDTWDSRKLEAKRRELRGEAAAAETAEGSARQEFKDLAAEFAAAAKGGSAAMKPFLVNLYQTRAAAYRDAVRQFIEGYKEGFQQANRPDIPPEVAQEMEAAKAAAAAEPPAAAGAAAPAPAQQQEQEQQGGDAAAADAVLAEWRQPVGAGLAGAPTVGAASEPAEASAPHPASQNQQQQVPAESMHVQNADGQLEVPSAAQEQPALQQVEAANELKPQQRPRRKRKQEAEQQPAPAQGQQAAAGEEAAAPPEPQAPARQKGRPRRRQEASHNGKLSPVQEEEPRQQDEPQLFAEEPQKRSRCNGD
eukprot:scaffold6.g2635.t1